MKSKGFIGPIGDDLPSLIPLVFALIIFFYSFTFAWNIYDERNSIFSDSVDVFNVAHAMRGSSYISGFEDFQENCSKARSIKRVNFRVGLLELSSNPLAEGGEHFAGFGRDVSDDFFDPPDSEKFECSNSSDDIPPLYSLRFFPVALQRDYGEGNDRHFFVKPMLLVVITWQ
ncbi:MAG: hypothetical protein JW772_01620 [Candidatus Diapherotrites archaeon]|nr:hypothetical protein [Candidatus Diapherotrites archaeon]